MIDYFYAFCRPPIVSVDTLVPINIVATWTLFFQKIG